MTQQDDITQRVLTDDEILAATLYGQSEARMIRNGRAIESALLSKLRAPVADERAAFVAWLTSSYPNTYKEPEAVRLWHHGHISALAWEERGRRAALRSAPADERALPLMPPTQDRRPDEIPGYLESDKEWIDRHLNAVRWLIDNHATIRAALASAPVAGEAQKPVAWLSDVGLESLRKCGQASVVATSARSVMSEFKHPCYAAPQASEADVRNAALEVAAVIVETAPDYLQDSSFNGAARAIRALKQPQADKDGAVCSCPHQGDGSLRWPCAVHGKGAGDVALPSEDDAAAHMYPSCLEWFKTGEHSGEAWSIKVGNINGQVTVPLFTADQVRAAVLADRQQRASPEERIIKALNRLYRRAQDAGRRIDIADMDILRAALSATQTEQGERDDG